MAREASGNGLDPPISEESIVSAPIATPSHPRAGTRREGRHRIGCLERERWRRVKQVLDSVLDRPEAERTAALEAACGDDDGLRAEVVSLLSGEGKPSPLDLASLAAR